jgi:hypothetical protein
MMFHPLAKAPSMKAFGRASVRRNSILCGSTTTMSPTVANSGVRGITTPFGGRAIRSYVALTSSAVKSAPSWNLTPLRRWKVYFLPSGEISQRWARSGMIVCPSFGLRLSRVSYIGLWAPILATVPDWCTSKCAGAVWTP